MEVPNSSSQGFVGILSSRSLYNTVTWCVPGNSTKLVQGNKIFFDCMTLQCTIQVGLRRSNIVLSPTTGTRDQASCQRENQKVSRSRILHPFWCPSRLLSRRFLKPQVDVLEGSKPSNFVTSVHLFMLHMCNMCFLSKSHITTGKQ